MVSLKCKLGIHNTGVDGTTRRKIKKKGIKEAWAQCKDCKRLVNLVG